MDKNNNNNVGSKIPTPSDDKTAASTTGTVTRNSRGNNGWFTSDQVQVLLRSFSQNRRSCPASTRRALAARTGLSFAAVSRWFRRHRGKARSSAVALLRAVFGSGGRFPDAETERRLALATGWEAEEVREWFRARRLGNVDRTVRAVLRGFFGAERYPPEEEDEDDSSQRLVRLVRDRLHRLLDTSSSFFLSRLHSICSFRLLELSLSLHFPAFEIHDFFTQIHTRLISPIDF